MSMRAAARFCSYSLPCSNSTVGLPLKKRRSAMDLHVPQAMATAARPYTAMAVRGSQKSCSRLVANSAAIEPTVMPFT